MEVEKTGKYSRSKGSPENIHIVRESVAEKRQLSISRCTEKNVVKLQHGVFYKII